MTGPKPKNIKLSTAESIQKPNISNKNNVSDQAVAKISIILPESAKLLIEESPTKQTGSSREFVSPVLEEDVDYVYHLKAEWFGPDGKNVTRETKVVLRAAQHHKVIFDFNSDRVLVEPITNTESIQR